MSNILIIKHGSLGDIVQASGAIQDIIDNHKDDDIYLLTSKPYINLFKKNNSIKGIILDNRSSKFNLIYLYLLMRNIKKKNITKVYDLQNSSRTTFYKKILYPKANKEIWSSSLTTLPSDINKNEFDKIPVLQRFDHQLKNSGLKTKQTLFPNFDWACEEIEEIKKAYNLSSYILLFPFCSPHLELKKWPYYNDLIKLIKNEYMDKYKILVAPGPKEIEEAKDINAISVLDEKKALNISQLGTLIKESSFIISNDTGPAHMAAHLGVKGITLFGKHTTAHKVSIERENFKSIQVNDLNKLSAAKVFERLKQKIN